ncbi:hypothetical protein HDU76_011687, partial [Blyttiomyces sp. JEL0837]
MHQLGHLKVLPRVVEEDQQYISSGKSLRTLVKRSQRDRPHSWVDGNRGNQNNENENEIEIKLGGSGGIMKLASFSDGVDLRRLLVNAPEFSTGRSLNNAGNNLAAGSLPRGHNINEWGLDNRFLLPTPSAAVISTNDVQGNNRISSESIDVKVSSGQIRSPSRSVVNSSISIPTATQTSEFNSDSSYNRPHPANGNHKKSSLRSSIYTSPSVEHNASGYGESMTAIRSQEAQQRARSRSVTITDAPNAKSTSYSESIDAMGSRVTPRTRSQSVATPNATRSISTSGELYVWNNRGSQGVRRKS